MITLQLMACIGLIAGAFMLFDISPAAFAQNLAAFLTRRPKGIRDEINAFTERKKPSFLRREILEAQEILALTGRSHAFPLVCSASLLLFATGAILAILLQNLFLLPVLALGMTFMPFWYVRLTAGHYKKNVAAELETALSIITSAYLRNEDILTAVEENIAYLNPPVKHVFAEFLTRMKLINPDLEAALRAMKVKIENEVFRQWCDAVAACQYDRSLKTTLTPIVTKLSDMRVVNGELDNLVFEPRKEFIVMVILVVGNIPLLYFLNQSWYNTLMHTAAGQLILAVCGIAIFVSAAAVIRLTKPIEYRR